jgi:hypothetical protein
MNRPVIAAGVRIAVMVIPSFDGQTGRFYAAYGAYRRNRRGCAEKRRSMLSWAWPGSPENGSAGGVVPMRTARAHSRATRQSRGLLPPAERALLIRKIALCARAPHRSKRRHQPAFGSM